MIRLISLVLGACLFASVTAAPLVEQSASVPVGTWFKPTTVNTIQSVDPGPGSYNANIGFRGIFEAWGGGTFFPHRGTCGAIAYFGGGHQDYFGNSIVELDICGDGNGPKWKRVTNPWVASPGESYFPRVPCGEYPNHSPAPPHTYGAIIAATDINLFITIAASSNMMEQVGAPQYAPCAWAYDYGAGVWRGPWPHGGAQYGAAAYDTLRHLVWFEAGSSNVGVFSSLDPLTGTITPYNKSSNVMHRRLDAMSGYDAEADRVVTFSFRNGGTSAVISERNPASPWTQGVSAVQVNKPAVISGASTMSWSDQRGAWIVWFATTTQPTQVYEVKRSAPNNVLTYTWTLLTDPANTVIPVTLIHNGVYGKAQVVTLSDGTELLIGITRVAEGTVAFKLGGPVAPLPPPPPPPVCIPMEVIPLEYQGLPLCAM